MGMSVKEITASESIEDLGATDMLYSVTTTDDVTLTLTKASDQTGQKITFYKEDDGGELTITPNGSETINGSSNMVMTGPHNMMTIISDGSNWVVTDSIEQVYP